MVIFALSPITNNNCQWRRVVLVLAKCSCTYKYLPVGIVHVDTCLYHSLEQIL